MHRNQTSQNSPAAAAAAAAAMSSHEAIQRRSAGRQQDQRASAPPRSTAPAAAAPPPTASLPIVQTAQSTSTHRRSSNRNRRAQRRRVQFSCRAAVWMIPSVNEMTPQEIDDQWTNEDDTARSQRDVVDTIKNMRRADASMNANSSSSTSGSTAHLDDQDGDDSICTRGLEHMRSATHLEQMRINKDCHYDAVFDEQDRQDHEGIVDENELALASEHCSRWAREKALERARGDEEFALRVRKQMGEDGELDSSSRDNKRNLANPRLHEVLEEALDAATGTANTCTTSSSSHPSSTTTSSSSNAIQRHGPNGGLSRNSFCDRHNK